MDRLNKITFIFIFFLSLLGCGVKGSPLPPLNPAPLGRGEPTFKESTSKKSTKKTIPKNQNNEEGLSPEKEER